jgi:hypothetical protein
MPAAPSTQSLTRGFLCLCLRHTAIGLLSNEDRYSLHIGCKTITESILFKNYDIALFKSFTVMLEFSQGINACHQPGKYPKQTKQHVCVFRCHVLTSL